MLGRKKQIYLLIYLAPVTMEVNTRNIHEHNLLTQGSRTSRAPFTVIPDTIFNAI